MTRLFRPFGRLAYKAPRQTVKLAQESRWNGKQTWQVLRSIFDAETAAMCYNYHRYEEICKDNLSSDKFSSRHPAQNGRAPFSEIENLFRRAKEWIYRHNAKKSDV